MGPGALYPHRHRRLKTQVSGKPSLSMIALFKSGFVSASFSVWEDFSYLYVPVVLAADTQLGSAREARSPPQQST